MAESPALRALRHFARTGNADYAMSLFRLFSTTPPHHLA